MRILLTGGTGLIGRELCQHWAAQGHGLVVLSRQPHVVAQLCAGARGVATLDELDSTVPFDAVVNLAGAPIADRPWTNARRKVLWASRVDVTRALVQWVGSQSHKPKVLLSGSAVGWYGDCADTELDEASPARQTDFGSRLCVAWEAEAQRAAQWGMRVVLLRTASVFASKGGLLARLVLPFRLGLGGRLGNGRQWMPWIHLEDEVALIDHLLQHDDCHGAYNACAPGLVQNADFTRALARTLYRPAFIPVPAWLLRLTLGEMSVLLLGGQRAHPRRALEQGFVFRHPTLEHALADAVHGRNGQA